MRSINEASGGRFDPMPALPCAERRPQSHVTPLLSLHDLQTGQVRAVLRETAGECVADRLRPAHLLPAARQEREARSAVLGRGLPIPLCQHARAHAA